MASRTKKPAAETNGHVSLEPITIQRLDRRTAVIPIAGTTELIVHRFSEKEKTKMRELHQQKARKKKEPKDPHAEYEAAMYMLPDGKRHGFPAVGFKACIIAGSRFFDGLTIVSMKPSIMVHGEGPDMLVPIEFGKMRMREDMVRVSNGSSDLRYRPAYWPWKAKLEITYVANMIGLESLVNLVNAGGMNGIGEWRPSAPKSMTGIFGTFEVEEAQVKEL